MFLEQTILADPPQTKKDQYTKFTVGKLCKKLRDRAGFSGLETYMLSKHGTIITSRRGVRIKFQIILEDEKHEFTGREYDLTADHGAVQGGNAEEHAPTTEGDQVHN